MLGVLHPTRRKNEGKSGRKDLELSERRKAFAREKRQRKRAERKAALVENMFFPSILVPFIAFSSLCGEDVVRFPLSGWGFSTL